MALTPKQKLFVKHYLIEQNATKAARKAGYSSKSANRAGSRMLSNVDIQKAIQEVVGKHHEELDLSIDKVLQRLSSIAFGNNFYKASDVIKSCELLGRYLGMFKEVHEISGPDGGPQVVTYIPNNGRKAQ